MLIAGGYGLYLKQTWFRWKPVRSPYHFCRREAVRRCRFLSDYEITKRRPRLAVR